MKKLNIRLLLIITSFLSAPRPSLSQIVPDSSLGRNSSVVTNGTIKGVDSKIVSGGYNTGLSLLHSLKEFNIDSGTGAYFSNPTGIQNIVVRVTGINSSSILGTLGVLGSANLFLLNPKGIIFGPNAKLDLNGSFLASTADSIQFENGYKFNSITANEPPLIQINIPVGLNFNKNTGTITVKGDGHNLITKSSAAAPLAQNGITTTGLSVSQGKTLAFVGGNVNFTGGISTAPSGDIDLASVSTGSVRININPTGSLSLDYKNILDRGDITLSNLSLLNASGFGGGNISLFGRNVILTDDSLALISNYGKTPSGSISINASGTATILGATANTVSKNNAGNGLRSEALSDGDGANINIFAHDLTIDNAGKIFTEALNKGNAGGININVEDTTQILGNSIFNPSYGVGSLIISSGLKKGRAGSIFLKTKILDISNGGLLSTSAYGTADGGNVDVEADEILVTGYNKFSLTPSQISANSLGSGKGGDLLINTKKASFTNGGSAFTVTQASGPAGNLLINATDFIDVSGSIPNSLPSSISASSLLANPAILKAFGLPPTPTGKSGGVTINTPLLKVSDGAAITVNSDGTGDAGNLNINTELTLLKNGNILASTNGGDGGIINITTTKLVAQNSLISASARGKGNGGNIFITSNIVFGDKNSYLRANAEYGRGGNITVDVDGFSFPRENITAISTSDANSNGKVNINATNTTLSVLSLYKPPNVRYTFSTTCKPDPRKSLSVRNGSGLMPEQYDEPIENTIHAKNTYYRLDLKTRKKIPLGEAMLSWRDNGGGKGSPVSELPDPLSIASLPAFHCFDSSPVSSAKIK
jgi:filamentous hemagglutinin family protein